MVPVVCSSLLFACLHCYGSDELMVHDSVCVYGIFLFPCYFSPLVGVLGSTGGGVFGGGGGVKD